MAKNSVNKTSVKKCWDLINKASKITLLTHFKPDGDGMSACAAFEDIILRLPGKKKSVETVYPSKPEFEIARQPKKILVNKHVQTPDLIIAFDTAGYDRLYFPDKFKKIPLINIDHHISNKIEGTLNLLDFDAASTCDIAYKIIKLYKKSLITPKVAAPLLFGILSDSMVFHTQSTTAATLKNASELIDLGAELFLLSKELLANKNPKIINFWGELMRNIEFTKDGKTAWAIIKQSDLKKFKLTLASLVGFNNFLAEISDVEVSAIIYETEEGDTKLSLRSKNIDVNKVAGKFGGGGHKNASGALIKKPIAFATRDIVEILEHI